MIPESGGLAICLKALHLSSFAACFQEMSGTVESQGWSHQQYLQHLAEIELEDRRQDRIERLLKASGLPRDKTLASLDMTVLPERVKKMLPSLCEGHFLGRAENIVAFGDRRILNDGLFPHRPFAASSSGIRVALRAGDWSVADDLLTPEVYDYIRDHDLYR